MGKSLVRLPGNLIMMNIFNYLRRRPQPSQAEPPHPFDVAHGLDTSGLYYADRLPSGHPHDRYSEGYYATAPSLFHGAISLWSSTLDADWRVEDYRFIDLGSGKGRVVVMASGYPFRSVSGIELSLGLIRIAKRNLRRWLRAGKAVSGHVRVEHGDVLALVPALLHEDGGPFLLFIFNSFAAEVLGPLMEKLAHEARRRAADSKGATAPIDIVYIHPDHDRLLAQVAGIELLRYAEIPFSQEDARTDLFGVSSDVCSIYRLLAAPSRS